MRPLGPSFFGSSGIGIQFNTGSSVVVGSIVRQIGMARYIATDGANKYTVTLASTPQEAGDLPPLRATLTAKTPGGGTENVLRLTADRCRTVQGSSFRWSIGTNNATGTVGGLSTVTQLTNSSNSSSNLYDFTTFLLLL
jgi:hypothetical protein